MASPQAEGYARRPVTRSLVKNGFIFIASSISDAPIQDKKSSFKKVKFVDLNSSAIHNSSVATDEGIDVSFTSSSANIPASICRPYHALSQNWIFWFSSGNKKASWNQNQISLASLETVEDFWILYNKVSISYSSYIPELPSGILISGAALQLPQCRPVLLHLQVWRDA